MPAAPPHHAADSGMSRSASSARVSFVTIARRSDVLHFHHRRSLRERMGSAPPARTPSGVGGPGATSGGDIRQRGSFNLGKDRLRSRRNLMVGRTRVRGESAMSAMYKGPTTIHSFPMLNSRH